MVEESEIIFVAVKPQFVTPVLKEVRSHLTAKHTIVSIAAGKTLSSLKVNPLPANFCAPVLAVIANQGQGLCSSCLTFVQMHLMSTGRGRGRHTNCEGHAQHTLLGRGDSQRHVPGGQGHRRGR